MALGGMRDHVGGGFHRYSVDADWRVPHFEKMLYDQAQLVLAYLEAAQALRSGSQALRPGSGQATANSFRGWRRRHAGVRARDLRDPGVDSYSAEDADSVRPGGDPKQEGAFYVWATTRSARSSALNNDADIVRKRFGIEPDGNAPQDPQGEFTGQNLLYTARTMEEIAAETGRDAEAVMAVLGRARQVLFDARARRPRPHLDDKVITSWNGMMIAAFARAARVLPERPQAAGVARHGSRRRQLRLRSPVG